MNARHPLVSVIIPNYNRGDLLQETLESMLRQDYAEWEALVVDDGSTDSSAGVGSKYTQKDRRIRYLERDRNPRGAPTCRNIGLTESSGEYVIFLDSDDLLTPVALSQRIETIQNYPELDFWVFPILMFRDDPAKATTRWNIDTGESDLHRFLILDAPWQTTGPIWRKEAVLKIGGFTEGLACWQDVDFHLKAIIAGLKGKKFYNLPPDVLYRQHETQSISQSEISSPAKLKSRFDIFRQHTLALRENNFKAEPSATQVRYDLQLLGGNIAIGAAKALNADICAKVIRFGSQQGIFSSEVVRQLLMFLAFYQLRLNKIAPLDNKVKAKTRMYRQDSNIGKHPYKQTN
jgi:glycosyltransferase involved in cell wall biosynthesis